jgi:hypothetical protein
MAPQRQAGADGGIGAHGHLRRGLLRVAIVYNTSASTALSLSKVTPYIWVGIFVAWTVGYGRYQQKKGQRLMAVAAAAAEEAGQQRR